MSYTTTRPEGLADAEVYVRADAPNSWARWYVRPDGTVVGQLPCGVWSTQPCVNATIVRSSRKWVRQDLA